MKIGERFKPNMSALAEVGEIIVAELAGQIVGAVVYIAAGAPKVVFFQPEWAIMLMLVVSPAARSLGIGRALAEEYQRRAKRDHVTVFALHTSTLMQVTLPMYQRMGFKWVANTPAIYGVEYSVYIKTLAD